MSARNDKSEVVVVGGEPRVSLLPPELEQRKRAAATRRLAVIVVFIAIAIGAVGTGAAWLYQIERNGRLDAARLETAALLQQQAKYADVRSAAIVVAAANDARIQVAATEIDWQDYLQKALDKLPAGAVVDHVQVDSSTVMQTYSPPTAPLQPARIGAISWEVYFPTVASVDDWIKGLEDLVGYVDARPTGVAWDANRSMFKAGVIFTYNEAILAHRYDTAADEGDTDGEAEPVVDEPEPSATPNPSGSATPSPSGSVTPSPSTSTGTEEE